MNETTASAASTSRVEPYQLPTALAWMVAALVFGAAGWLYGWQPLSIAIGNWRLASAYAAVQAKVVTREGKAADGTSATWLAASYEVNGKNYFAERLSVLDDDSLDEAYNNTVLGWLERAQRDSSGAISVYVSPRHPEISLVSNELPLPSLMSRAPLALGFSLLAAVAALGAVGALCNFGYYRRLSKNKRGWVLTAALCGLVFPIMSRVGTDADSGEFTVDVMVFLTAIAALFLCVVTGNTLEKDADVVKATGKVKRDRAAGRADGRASKR